MIRIPFPTTSSTQQDVVFVTFAEHFQKGFFWRKQVTHMPQQKASQQLTQQDRGPLAPLKQHNYATVYYLIYYQVEKALNESNKACNKCFICNSQWGFNVVVFTLKAQ